MCLSYLHSMPLRPHVWAPRYVTHLQAMGPPLMVPMMMTNHRPCKRHEDAFEAVCPDEDTPSPTIIRKMNKLKEDLGRMTA